MAQTNTKPGMNREIASRILLKPVITEKSTRGSEHNQVSFYVPVAARKPEIKSAVEALFKVKVKAVNTTTLGGKEKFFRGRLGERSDKKKAIITLMPGQTIDITTGI